MLNLGERRSFNSVSVECDQLRNCFFLLILIIFRLWTYFLPKSAFCCLHWWVTVRLRNRWLILHDFDLYFFLRTWWKHGITFELIVIWVLESLNLVARVESTWWPEAQSHRFQVLCTATATKQFFECLSTLIDEARWSVQIDIRCWHEFYRQLFLIKTRVHDWIVKWDCARIVMFLFHRHKRRWNYLLLGFDHQLSGRRLVGHSILFASYSLWLFRILFRLL